MKKALLVMLSVLLAVSAVFAGGAKEGSSNGSLRFMWWGGDARNAATVDVINKYMEENPEISIAAEINSDSGYVDKVAVMLASGTAPDIMQQNVDAVPDFVSRGDFFVDNAIRHENNELIKTQNVSETCQYYAFYFLDNLEIRYSKLFKKLVNKFGPNREEKTYYPNVYKSNVFIGNYLRLMILNRNSYYSQTYKEIISYYYKMAKLTSTLWEHDSPHASLNHGFASYILISFIEANFGLKEISLKDKRIVIDKAGLHKDGEISIPVLDDYLILRCKNGEQEVIAPNDFSIVYKGE